MITEEQQLGTIKLVIFDVDGTLYNQRKLQLNMCLSLLKYYLVHPLEIKDLYILYQFRKEREKHSGYNSNNLNEEQYEWCASKLHIPLKRVKAVISKWIYDMPLQYLRSTKYSGTSALFDTLRRQNIKIAVYSDYPANDKLNVMGLKTDISVSSTDAEINSFKPSPRAVYFVCKELNIAKEACLFIGDRDSRDGQCARNAGIRYIVLPSKNKDKEKLFVFLAHAFEMENRVN
ncbi:MAG TPA: HAD family hydrolase [Niabella sp.]|nr:HAD family hydrolase [Niabella sp.]